MKTPTINSDVPELKKALVIGVGPERGLGATISARFAREGFHVFVAGRTAQSLEQVVQQIQSRGGAATAIVADTTQEADVQALFDRGRAGFAAFNSAKAGLRNLAQAMAKELGPKGLHVGHVVVDGGIDGDKLRKGRPEMVQRFGEDRLIDLEGLADAYWYLHQQPPRAWTFELDLRSKVEPW
ncbi:MAG: SDR family NAD(P)-dependent oxidoreductase [Burkholderiaceae bacterium]|nr:SDR family NAD(P)-dependent oxidoreductase [Burkholderiaceae bacterium]